jgi:hypothetical protein
VREKYCWLTGGWWLVLNWCERKALLAGWQPASRTRPMYSCVPTKQFPCKPIYGFKIMFLSAHVFYALRCD